MKNIYLVFILLLPSFGYNQSLKSKIEENRFIERKDLKYGVIDSLNKTIVPFKYNFIEFQNSRLIVRNNNLHGLLSLENKELIPVKYQYILPKKYDRFILYLNNSLFGMSDIDGDIILPVKYKSINSTENEDFYITKNNTDLNGVYNFKGINIVPEEFKFYTIDNYKIFAAKNNQSQIIDLQNPGIPQYLDNDIQFIETIRHYCVTESLFQIVKKQNKYGVINSKNENIIPVIYDEIKSSENWRYFIIKLNNKLGLININGKIAKQPIYDQIELRKEHILLKRKNFKDEIYAYEF